MGVFCAGETLFQGQDQGQGLQMLGELNSIAELLAETLTFLFNNILVNRFRFSLL